MRRLWLPLLALLPACRCGGAARVVVEPAPPIPAGCGLKEVRLQPARPVTGEPVRCVFRPSPPGQTVSVRWEGVTDPPLPGPGDTPELPGAWVRPGRQLRCTVTLPECAASSATVEVAPNPRPSNVLILIIDDISAFELPPYRDPNALHAPRITRLAEEGVTFTRAWAHPLCGPSRATLLTGRHPIHTLHGTNVHPNATTGSLRPEEITIAEWLADAPSRWGRAAVGKWHLGTRAEGGAQQILDQGFEHHRGASGNLYTDQSEDGGPLSYTDWEKSVDAGPTVRTQGYITVDEADDAIALSQELREPWLLYVAFHATHEPHANPPSSLLPKGPTSPSTGHRHEFAGMLEVLDAQIGRILDAVPADTHVILVGDNGDDKNVIPRGRSAYEVKGSMYEGGLHVPLIIRSPLVGAPGGRARALVDMADLFPTIAEFGQRPAAHTDGRSLVPFLINPALSDDATAWAERTQPNDQPPTVRRDQAIRDDRFKLVRNLAGTEFLFEVGDSMDDGPDLLHDGMSDDAWDAWVDLRARLDRGDVR